MFEVWSHLDPRWFGSNANGPSLNVQVDGIPVEVVRVSLFFKQKLTVMMIDVSLACTVSKCQRRLLMFKVCFF